MSFVTPSKPLTTNPGTTAASSVDQVLSQAVGPVGVNQIRGINVAGAVGSGIPKHVTNTGVSIANGQTGATSAVTISFRRDPSDTSFNGVNIWVKGYQGNSTPTQVASGADSPTTFVLNNTGENVSFAVQSFGNGGRADLKGAPVTSGTLPKSTTGGYGTTTVVSYNSDNPPPPSSTVFSTAGQGFFYGNKNHPLVYENSGVNPAAQTANNDIVVMDLFLESEWDISKIVAYCTTGSGTGDSWTTAIYSYDGNTKLVDAGAHAFTTLASQHQFVIPITTVKLLPSSYRWAFGATSKTSLGAFLGFDGTTFYQELINDGVTARFGIAANTLSGAAMPATLGAITPVTKAITQSVPMVAFCV